MRPPQGLLRTLVLCFASFLATASLAAAAHVPPVLPLSSSPNHSNEKFSPTVFPAGNYSNYIFAGADLSSCTFAAGTNLTGANFSGAKLTNVNFSGCTLDLATFLGADLSFATLPCFGGGDLRGAILTGVNAAGTGCAGCFNFGPNATDVCTVNPAVNLCVGPFAFRGLVSGVVYDDLNSNGVLDFGEPGVPGASVGVSVSPTSVGGSTDSRGGFFFVIPNSGTGTVSVTLPAGYALAGPAGQSLNLGICRSSQGVNFAAHSAATATSRTTFGRVKILYR